MMESNRGTPSRSHRQPARVWSMLVSLALGLAAVAIAVHLMDMGPAQAQEADADGTSSDASSDNESQTGDNSSSSQDSSDVADIGIIVLVVLGAAVVILLLTLVLRPRSPRTPSPPRVPSRGWRTRVERLCADGRATVDLTVTMTKPSEPGSGLSVDQLRTIEGRIDLLIAELHDVELRVPSELASQHLRIAASHARALNDIVQTERRIKLSSVSPDDQMLEATASQLIQERTALDQSMRDISISVAASP